MHDWSEDAKLRAKERLQHKLLFAADLVAKKIPKPGQNPIPKNDIFSKASTNVARNDDAPSGIDSRAKFNRFCRAHVAELRRTIREHEGVLIEMVRGRSGGWKKANAFGAKRAAGFLTEMTIAMSDTHNEYAGDANELYRIGEPTTIVKLKELGPVRVPKKDESA